MKAVNFLKLSLKLSLCLGFSSFSYATQQSQQKQSQQGAKCSGFEDAQVECRRQQLDGQLLKNITYVGTCTQEEKYFKETGDNPKSFDVGFSVTGHVSFKGDSDAVTSQQTETETVPCAEVTEIMATYQGTRRATCAEILAADNVDVFCAPVLESGKKQHEQNVADGSDLMAASGQSEQSMGSTVSYTETGKKRGCTGDSPKQQQQQEKQGGGSKQQVAAPASVEFSSPTTSPHSHSSGDNEDGTSTFNSSNSESSSSYRAPGKKNGGKGNAVDVYYDTSSSDPSSSDKIEFPRGVTGGAQLKVVRVSAKYLDGKHIPHDLVRVVKAPTEDCLLTELGIEEGDLFFAGVNDLCRIKSFKTLYKILVAPYEKFIAKGVSTPIKVRVFKLKKDEAGNFVSNTNDGSEQWSRLETKETRLERFAEEDEVSFEEEDNDVAAADAAAEEELAGGESVE